MYKPPYILITHCKVAQTPIACAPLLQKRQRLQRKPKRSSARDEDEMDCDDGGASSRRSTRNRKTVNYREMEQGGGDDDEPVAEHENDENQAPAVSLTEEEEELARALAEDSDEVCGHVPCHPTCYPLLADSSPAGCISWQGPEPPRRKRLVKGKPAGKSKASSSSSSSSSAAKGGAGGGGLHRFFSKSTARPGEVKEKETPQPKGRASTGKRHLALRRPARKSGSSDDLGEDEEEDYDEPESASEDEGHRTSSRRTASRKRG
jgi:hypothetical protein